MQGQLFHVIRCVWRGVWRPQPLPPDARWHDRVAHWSFCLRDIMAGLVMLAMPPALAFVVYENFTTKPLVTLGFALLVSAIWLFAATVAYFVGRRSPGHA